MLLCVRVACSLAHHHLTPTWPAQDGAGATEALPPCCQPEPSCWGVGQACSHSHAAHQQRAAHVKQSINSPAVQLFLTSPCASYYCRVVKLFTLYAVWTVLDYCANMLEYVNCFWEPAMPMLFCCRIASCWCCSGWCRAKSKVCLFFQSVWHVIGICGMLREACWLVLALCMEKGTQ